MRIILLGTILLAVVLVWGLIRVATTQIEMLIVYGSIGFVLGGFTATFLFNWMKRHGIIR